MKVKQKAYYRLAIMILVAFLAVATMQLVPTATSVDGQPSPWITEPSVSDPEAPHHNGTVIVWGNLTNMSAVELNYASDIENTTFEYSPDGSIWNTIGISYEGIKEYENWTDVCAGPLDGFSAWSVVWNTSEINEGSYCIRATMANTAGQIGQDNVTVYFDPTPPIASFVVPWGTGANGTVQISVQTNATDVVYTQFESLKVSTEYNIPVVKEKDTACIWNSVASVLIYWANRPDKDDPENKPLLDLIKDKNGNVMNATQLIDALVARYNKGSNKPKTRGVGLAPDEIESLLKKWVEEEKGHKGWVKTKGAETVEHTLPFDAIAKEFEEGPLIVAIYHLGGKEGHSLVLKSLSPKPTEKLGEDFTYYRSEFVDITAKAGIRINNIETWKYENQTRTYIWMDWNENGKTDTGVPPADDDYWPIKNKYQILPDKDTLNTLNLTAYWKPESIDYDGSDGWSLVLDTTTKEEGYHFIKATMVDSSGNNGTQITEVFVDNIPPVPGDHDVAVTSLVASDAFITVVVENQGRYNETVYVSVYYRTVDPTLRVDLESGTNATLRFEWNPAMELYEITAEVDRVMDELDAADNRLTITTRVYDSGSRASRTRSLDRRLEILSEQR